MNLRLDRAITGLMSTIASLHNEDDFCLFMSFSGHIGMINIDVHENGYESEKWPTHQLRTYFSQPELAPDPIEDIHAIEDKLIEIHDKYRGKK